MASDTLTNYSVVQTSPSYSYASGEGYRYVFDGTAWHWGGSMTVPGESSLGTVVKLSSDGRRTAIVAQDLHDGRLHPTAHIFDAATSGPQS